MGNFLIQDAFHFSYAAYCNTGNSQSGVQRKAARAIMKCKTGAFGCNVSRCDDCGYTEVHSNSCRNRNCPNCQAVLKEIWVDKRKSEVIDSPYFHVVFTLPHELNPLIYCNQNLLYGLLHKCTAETLLELSSDHEYLGRYAHKIAISNSRILSVDESKTVFSARGKKPGDPTRTITLENEEFIRRFLLHVLPPGFQKIRYYGFLNNRTKKKTLELIFKLQGFQKFKSRYIGMTMAELIEAVWHVNVHVCKECGCMNMKPLGISCVPIT